MQTSLALLRLRASGLARNGSWTVSVRNALARQVPTRRDSRRSGIALLQVLSGVRRLTHGMRAMELDKEAGPILGEVWCNSLRYRYQRTIMRV